MRNYALLLALAALFLSACNKDDTISPEEQLRIDQEKIQQYLSEKGLTAQTLPSGLSYIHTLVGTGGSPSVQSTVSVKYKGYFLDGKVFDQSGSLAVTFPLSNLIPAWQEGIPLMKKGGKTTLFCPSALAYGTRGAGTIPPNTPLIFDIELVNF
jgi:FKBP-type peptidyl-prolyl cis-trans isomerase FkpA